MTVTPSRADSPGRRPQETSSVSRADGRAPGLAATTGAPVVPDAMIGLGERLLGRRDEIDGEQLEVDHHADE